MNPSKSEHLKMKSDADIIELLNNVHSHSQDKKNNIFYDDDGQPIDEFLYTLKHHTTNIEPNSDDDSVSEHDAMDDEVYTRDSEEAKNRKLWEHLDIEDSENESDNNFYNKNEDLEIVSNRKSNMGHNKQNDARINIATVPNSHSSSSSNSNSKGDMELKNSKNIQQRMNGYIDEALFDINRYENNLDSEYVESPSSYTKSRKSDTLSDPISSRSSAQSATGLSNECKKKPTKAMSSSMPITQSSMRNKSNKRKATKSKGCKAPSTAQLQSQSAYYLSTTGTGNASRRVQHVMNSTDACPKVDEGSQQDINNLNDVLMKLKSYQLRNTGQLKTIRELEHRLVEAKELADARAVEIDVLNKRITNYQHHEQVQVQSQPQTLRSHTIPPSTVQQIHQLKETIEGLTNKCNQQNKQLKSNEDRYRLLKEYADRLKTRNMELEVSGETLSNSLQELQQKYVKMKGTYKDASVESTVIKEILSEKEHQHEQMAHDYQQALEKERNLRVAYRSLEEQYKIEQLENKMLNERLLEYYQQSQMSKEKEVTMELKHRLERLNGDSGPKNKDFIDSAYMISNKDRIPPHRLSHSNHKDKSLVIKSSKNPYPLRKQKFNQKLGGYGSGTGSGSGLGSVNSSVESLTANENGFNTNTKHHMLDTVASRMKKDGESDSDCSRNQVYRQNDHREAGNTEECRTNRKSPVDLEVDRERRGYGISDDDKIHNARVRALDTSKEASHSNATHIESKTKKSQFYISRHRNRKFDLESGESDGDVGSVTAGISSDNQADGTYRDEKTNIAVHTMPPPSPRTSKSQKATISPDGVAATIHADKENMWGQGNDKGIEHASIALSDAHCNVRAHHRDGEGYDSASLLNAADSNKKQQYGRLKLMYDRISNAKK